jgi:hypothetical protein
MLAADEVFRCIGGTWDLLQRRRRGLRRFGSGSGALARSFAAVALCAPVFVAFLAATRLRAGIPNAGGDLFDRLGPMETAAAWLLLMWLTTPLVALPVAFRFGLLDRYRGFLVVANWSSVLACWFAALPASLYALGLATPALADLDGVAVLVLVAHLRWFGLKSALGLPARWAAAVAIVTLGLQTWLSSLVG